MADPRRDDLEQALLGLGERVDFPPTPDVARAVRARLVATSPPRRARTWAGWLWPPRTFAVASLVIVVLAAAVLALSHDARSTVADRLGIGGVDVEIVSSPSATIVVPSPSPAGANLALGTLTTLDQAEATLGFPPVDPPLEQYGPPDEVWVKQLPGSKQLTYVYRPRTGLLDTTGTGVGMLISMFAGDTNDSFIQKQLGDAARLEAVSVNGVPAFWITGAPHVFYYKDPTGGIQEETLRLAGNTLIWEYNGFTLRIESSLAQEQALAIADAITPQP